MTLEESLNTNEAVLNHNDIDFVVDNVLEGYLNPATPIIVDYRKTKDGWGFRIETGSGC
jgi:Fe-S cluster assembly iron-binding protein IscA